MLEAEKTRQFAEQAEREWRLPETYPAQVPFKSPDELPVLLWLLPPVKAGGK